MKVEELYTIVPYFSLYIGLIYIFVEIIVYWQYFNHHF